MFSGDRWAGTLGKARSCKYHRPAANLGQKGDHPVAVGLGVAALANATTYPLNDLGPRIALWARER